MRWLHETERERDREKERSGSSIEVFGRSRRSASEVAHSCVYAFHVRRHEKISLTPERTFAAYHGLIPDPQGSSRRGCKPENVAAKLTLRPPSAPFPPFPSSVTVAAFGTIPAASLGQPPAYPDDTRSIP